jgi:excinuclease ABC subunit A
VDNIRIIGAREHNLKNISLEVPRGKFVLITGVSGSGKSSLAFDTIFAEGQRRYMESLSAYARQFVEKIDKPDIDTIEGLSPSISVDQKTFQRNPRSTVGTITEIYDFLRLLFARLGKPFCYECGNEISSQSVERMVNRLIEFPKGERISIYSPIVQGRKGEYRKELNELKGQGFLKVRIDGKLLDLDDEIHVEKNKKHTIELLVDVADVTEKDLRGRIRDSLKLALKRSGGVAKVESSGGNEIIFSEKFSCPTCGISYPEISPRLFSFNSPYGACTECEGLGKKTSFDPDLIIDDKGKSLEDGAIIPWRNSRYFSRMIGCVADHFRFSIQTPYSRLPGKIKKIILYGSGDEEIRFYRDNGRGPIEYWDTFPGVIGILSDWYHETTSDEVRMKLSNYVRAVDCSTCNGSRLKKESLSIQLNGMSISDITRLTVGGCIGFFSNLSFSGQEKEVGERIQKEIGSRLEFLADVGLDYLTLDRSATTLSGGEGQRIRLATQVGSRLTGITYVLDEPTIGLHPKDNQRLISTLKSLRDRGNTILVVEHDEETIRNSDFIVDMGPGAGEKGGEVIAHGDVYDLMKNERSLTGRYLSRQLSIPVPGVRRKPAGFLRVKGASENNLKELDVSIPLGALTCVTGVSGSGKSTLVIDTLYNALCSKFYGGRERVGRHKTIEGYDKLDKVVNVDQTPIGRTPRSNPATYTGVFTPLRELFSILPDSRLRGYSPSRFSFNVQEGRCNGCQGNGIVKIEMHFLPDVYVRCDQCGGKRYDAETLGICYKGKNISDILEMTVSEALDFFSGIPKLRQRLDVLHAVGLDYIRLGQAATTLSGGEAQRIKLAKELSKKATGKTLYVLDEPTIGLHFEDVKRLIDVLQRLVDSGNTIVVIEHNLEVLKCSDYIIDLGPEGGENGGRMVANGTPEEVSRFEGSYTGKFLKRVL